MTQHQNKKKDPFYFYIITLLIPVIFFILFEVCLRLFGYGYSIPQWVHPSGHFPDYIILNPEITRRYFHQIKARPSPTYDGFFENKKKNAFRVFVMGGSTAAGFPYTINGSFSRYIRHYLEAKYPDRVIEVINLGISAVNTYTLRDLLPGVIDKQPDLVVIYAGHNEYYGALGAGSAEYLGSVRPLVNGMIAAGDIRTIQLLRSSINGVRNLFAGKNDNRSDETLMSRMIGEQVIPFQSDVYYRGINQFSDNLRDMMALLKEHSIPCIISTLTANLKDQPPFMSVPFDTLRPADEVFEQAQTAFNLGEYQGAGKLYAKAKDLDALRFRGPEAINDQIKTIGNAYKIVVVLMDSIFRATSPQGIPGDNLFIDHVHPTLRGYRLMGKTFVEMMEKSGVLPDVKIKLETETLHRLVKKRLSLTPLDSLSSMLRITHLKGGWPFVKTKQPNRFLQNYQPANYIEELALGMLLKQLNWEDAHLKAAVWYKGKGLMDGFVDEMTAIIENIPLNEKPFVLLIDGLIAYGRIDAAYPYLRRLDSFHPGAYSKKWLGTYYLFQKEYTKALDFLLQSFRFNTNDTQLLYNLAGAYLYNNDKQKALETIDKCLMIDGTFPGARIMKRDLERILGSGK